MEHVIVGYLTYRGFFLPGVKYESTDLVMQGEEAAPTFSEEFLQSRRRALPSASPGPPPDQERSLAAPSPPVHQRRCLFTSAPLPPPLLHCAPPPLFHFSTGDRGKEEGKFRVKSEAQSQ
ncbi:hypothetical protein Droror1_Dr00012927 [Drosera rotundifolia]